MRNPISESGPWTLGVLIGLPIGLLVTLAALVALVIFLRNAIWWTDGIAREGAWMGVALTGTVFLGAAALTVWATFPFGSEYHQWRTVQGEVQQINKRLVASGDSMAERYVVVIEGQPFGVDDTRASLLKVGDDVTLKCKREYQYAANSGWACNWGQPS